MFGKKSVLGLAVVASTASIMGILPGTAYADYAPTSNDVVGVGSDTLQALGNFVADGDFLGDPGYNAGKRNKFISIDATADANTRLAYSTGGVGSVALSCAPGTGATVGTGNQNVTHTDSPCSLNPTVLLRQGLSPVPRPNGSGAGFSLLKADTNAAGVSSTGLVDFSRASSARGSNVLFDSITVGTDPLGMLTSSTTDATNALSIAQIKSIYNCTATNWSSFGTGSGTIVPLIPQVGSGTRGYFLQQIGLTDATIGSCVKAIEENDPEAIDASGSPANAVEPMSQSRLYLFQGKLSDGTSNGLGGYFKDSSCPALSTATACATPTSTLNPNVKLWTSTDPVPTDAGTTFYPTRPVYFYFRHADQTSTKAFQPGSTLNWVKTMLNNPGGAPPYFCTGAGQALISASGIIPACTFNLAGP